MKKLVEFYKSIIESNLKGSLAIFVITIIASLVVYIPFRNNPDIIHKYWDGPNYMFIAKTMYNIPKTHPLSPYRLENYYFSSHLPLFPIVIRAINFFGFNYLIAMSLAILLCSGFASVAVFLYFKETGYVKYPFWSALLLIFFPIRMLLYRSIGATEPLFIGLIALSFLAYTKEKYVWAFTLAALASITRIFGILLLTSYFITIIHERKFKLLKLLPIIPFMLLLTFIYYHFIYGDFFAYFRYNGAVMSSFPINIFRIYVGAKDAHSSEYYFVLYAINILGIAQLWRKKETFYFSAMYFIAMLFVVHLDLSRYMLPLAPFALAIGFDNLLSKRSAAIVLTLIPLIYFYTWGFIPTNVILDWVWNDLLKFLFKT